jgi:hypothetical protein
MDSYGDSVKATINKMIVLTKNDAPAGADAVSKAAGLLLTLYKEQIKLNLTNKTDAQKNKIFQEFVCHPAALEILIDVV